MKSPQNSIWEQESGIESKQKLLEYLRSGPKSLTMESYLCLAAILSKAQWQFYDGLWLQGGLRLPLSEAAELEINNQIRIEKEKMLRQTVAQYSSKPLESGGAKVLLVSDYHFH